MRSIWDSFDLVLVANSFSFQLHSIGDTRWAFFAIFEVTPSLEYPLLTTLSSQRAWQFPLGSIERWSFLDWRSTFPFQSIDILWGCLNSNEKRIPSPIETLPGDTGLMDTPSGSTDGRRKDCLSNHLLFSSHLSQNCKDFSDVFLCAEWLPSSTLVHFLRWNRVETQQNLFLCEQ